MVTIQNAVQYVNGVACTTQKIWCKSTDVKPTEGIGNGSQLREMDTGKDYAFDAENGEWLEQPSEGGGGGGGGSSTLSGLTDVDISNPTDGQTLVYNAATGKWENGSAGGGGGALVVRGETVDNKVTLDHTYAEITSAAPLVYYANTPTPNRTVFTPLMGSGTLDGLYVLQFGKDELFSTESEDGYPVSHGLN